MRTIYIVFDTYCDSTTKQITIGGVQTYISELINIFNKLGFLCVVVQLGDKTSIIKMNKFILWTFKIAGNNAHIKIGAELYKKIGPDTDDIVLYASDGYVTPGVRFKHTIAIQHGIYWDTPKNLKRTILRMSITAGHKAYEYINRFKNIDKIVCVDYNFINWYRTQCDVVDCELIAIPNFAHIASVNPKPIDTINIIFARRLWWYRGTRIFTDAILPILEKYDNIRITVAGTGPDENYMREKLSSYKNVSFISYSSDESIAIHADKHIAIVPTVGSEGTSLSLLEAMSSQCACIASNVGGMTNIILDGYNGMLVGAGSVDELREAIIYLINNPDKIERLGEKAYETVKSSFSFEKWADKWTKVINNV